MSEAKEETILASQDNEVVIHLCGLELSEAQLQDIADSSAAVGGSTVSAAATGRKKTYVFRKVCEAEFEEIMRNKALPDPKPNPVSGEKWISESTKHTRGFQNKGAVGKQVTAEIAVKPQEYGKIRSEAIPQQGSRAKQPKEGPKLNIFNKEHLQNHPTGKVNIGLKGASNVQEFNTTIISIGKIDEKTLINRSPVFRWIRRHGLRVGVTAIGIAFDGITLGLSIYQDGGFGPRAQRATLEIAAGSSGAAIGAALGSVVPGLGTTIGGILGGFVGSFVVMLLYDVISDIKLGRIKVDPLDVFLYD